MLKDYGVRIYLANGLYILVNKNNNYYITTSLGNILEKAKALNDYNGKSENLKKVLLGAIEIDEIKNPELFI